MRNPLAVNVHAENPAYKDRCEQVWEKPGTVVADCRIPRYTAFVAVPGFPIQGSQARNTSKSIVDRAFADKNGEARGHTCEHELIAQVREVERIRKKRSRKTARFDKKET